MKTIIGVVGSNRESRLKLMKELSSKLKSKGYQVMLVFYDHNDSCISTSSTLIINTFGTTTFVRANFKLNIDDLKKLLPSTWCLILIEGYKATRYIVAAVSEEDIKELGHQSMAIIPLDDELIRAPTCYDDKVMTIDEAVEVIRKVLIEDIMMFLMREDCGECGFSNCRDLAEAIARGESTPLKCVKRRENVRLVVDGDLIRLNPFTSKVFIQVLTGLLSILKGVPKNFRKVTIELNLD